MWVFSGRRGVHCWVSDARARQMSLSARKSIVSYLEVAKVAILNRLWIFREEMSQDDELFCHQRFHHQLSTAACFDFLPIDEL
jgi:DNA primase catalytic subunit